MRLPRFSCVACARGKERRRTAEAAAGTTTTAKRFYLSSPSVEKGAGCGGLIALDDVLHVYVVPVGVGEVVMPMLLLAPGRQKRDRYTCALPSGTGTGGGRGRYYCSGPPSRHSSSLCAASVMRGKSGPGSTCVSLDDIAHVMASLFAHNRDFVLREVVVAAAIFGPRSLFVLLRARSLLGVRVYNVHM